MDRPSNSASPDKRLHILIAEDHTLIRKMTQQLVTSFYASPQCDETDSIIELVDLIKKNKYDLIILDIFLIDGNTVTLLPTLRTMQPQAGVLFFTMCPEKLYAKRLILNGANGFLNKRADEFELKTALDTLLEGNNFFSRKLQQQLSEEAIGKKADTPFDSLSDREFEVMLLLLQGKGIKEICNELNLHISTVSTHKIRLFEKLNVSSLMELNKLATAHDVVT